MWRSSERKIKIGQAGIQSVKLDIHSRDEIPKILFGLQSIQRDKDIMDEIYDAMRDMFPADVNLRLGRNGMSLWEILVLGNLRLCCNWDYDHLREMANKHADIRIFLLNDEFQPKHQNEDEDEDEEKEKVYSVSRVKDNVRLFTPEVLDKINVIVVKHGHKIIGKKPDEELFGSCDPFPVLTDVHFPTDINLLWDAMRKIVTIIMILSQELGLEGWRKGAYNLNKVKRLFRRVQKSKRSTSKNPEKKAERDRLIIAAHMAYLEFAEAIIKRAKETLSEIRIDAIPAFLRALEIQQYIDHAERQIDQIRRRVVEGESIPHADKVFSLFEEHTEWIVKGKAGVLVELGLNVCIVKDQFGFILFHHVMEHETDDQVAVPIIKEVQKRFDNFTGCSFDKGFHSPDNQEILANLLDKVVLPRKGKLSAINKEIENSEQFIEARRKHSAVESSINALENGGLDRCPDHGIDGFKRYVGLAVLARNLHTIGNVIQKKAVEQERRRRAQKKRLAA